MMRAKEQQEKILEYLKNNKCGLTNRYAVVMLNINSPTKRISELRKHYHISDVWEHTEGGSRYKRYFYQGEKGVVTPVIDDDSELSQEIGDILKNGLKEVYDLSEKKKEVEFLSNYIDLYDKDVKNEKDSKFSRFLKKLFS